MFPIRFRLRFDVRTTEREYRANMAGLNTFFGAVLGFLVTGFDQFDLRTYMLQLVLCSAIVICILYVANSPNRWTYVVLAAILIFLLPELAPDGLAIPDKLQPTFAVWLALAVLYELSPRKPDAPATAAPPAAP